MKRSQLITSLLGVCLMTASAWANGDDADEQAEAKAALAKAKITLAKAVEIAQKEVPGRTPFEAELELEGDAATYEVKLLVGKSVKEVQIDAASGKVLEVEDEDVDDQGAEIIEKAKPALGKMKIAMPQAIGIAAKEVKGGKAYEAELELEDGRLTYEVELLAGEKFMEVEIDAVTGKVLEVEEEGEDEDEDEDASAGSWSFDRNTAGKVSEGWSIQQTRPSKALATWQVVADPTAPSKPNVFALTKTENYDGTFNLAIAEKTSFKDIDLTVKVKGIQGKEDQGGGPIWRCKDENNYYICRFNPLEGNYRVYKVANGRRKQLKSIKVETEAGKWYAVRVTMVGNKITCYLDGKKMLEAKDDTFKGAGMVGLWTKSDAVTSFDDLTVK